MDAVNSGQAGCVVGGDDRAEAGEVDFRESDPAECKVRGGDWCGVRFLYRAGEAIAPVFQRLGLEWLPRLFQQPRRLWRRMFVSAPIFLWHVLREHSRRLFFRR